MKSSWVILCGGTLLLGAAGAQAAKKPIKDPQVIIAGGNGSLPVGDLFSFISPTGTSPLSLPGGSACLVGLTKLLDCIFKNGSDQRWTSLTFTITPSGQLVPFTCLALAFFSGCFFSDNHTKLTFFGGTGLPAGGDFLVAVVLWLPWTKFTVQASSGDSSTRVLRGQPFESRQRGSTAPDLALFLDGHVALAQCRRLEPAA